MKQLTEIPKGYKATLTNGEAILYISNTNSETAVLKNERTGVTVELPVQSALARGYWREIESPKE